MVTELCRLRLKTQSNQNEAMLLCKTWLRREGMGKQSSCVEHRKIDERNDESAGTCGARKKAEKKCKTRWKYHSTGNKFERFRGFLELIRRFEFEFCRLENYFY